MDFEVSIKPHTKQVVFGDPLYLEVTVVNRGEEAVKAALPDPWSSVLQPRMIDVERDIEVCWRFQGHHDGSSNIGVLEPGVPKVCYIRVCLPHISQTEHAFWKPIRSGGGEVAVYVDYRPWKNVRVRGNAPRIEVKPRKRQELDYLVGWIKKGDQELTEEFLDSKWALMPNCWAFGLRLQILSREATRETVSVVRSGELKTIVGVTDHLQEIYALPEDERAPLEAAMVKWWKDTPHSDVFKKGLALDALWAARGARMQSTAKAIEGLLPPELVPPEW